MTAEFMTLQEIVQTARTQLSRGDWDYLITGADTETSLKRNRLAIDRLALNVAGLPEMGAIHTGGERMNVVVLVLLRFVEAEAASENDIGQIEKLTKLM